MPGSREASGGEGFRCFLEVACYSEDPRRRSWWWWRRRWFLGGCPRAARELGNWYTYYHHNHNHGLEVLGNLPSIPRRIIVLRRDYMFPGGLDFDLCISKLFPSLGDMTLARNAWY